MKEGEPLGEPARVGGYPLYRTKIDSPLNELLF